MPADPVVEIIGAPQSVYVRATRLALEEKGVRYALRPAMPHSEEILAINPYGKIPAMRHGDFELFESKAIATYIDRAFSGPRLVPEDARLAARTEQWISAINTSVFPALVGYMQANAFPKGPGGEPDRAMVDGFLPTVRSNIRVLDKAVSPTGHLSGESFTLADMFLMPILTYLRAFPESREMMAEAHCLSAYFERHCARASYQNTVPPPL